MRTRSALVLLALGLSLPALAQRGGGGMRSGGFSGGGMRSGGFSGGGMRSGGFSGGGMRSGGMHSGGFATHSTGTYGRSYPSVRTANTYARYPGTRAAFPSRNSNLYNSGNHPGNSGSRRYGYGFPGLFNYGYGYPFYNSFLDDDDLFWGDNNPNNVPNQVGDNGQPEDSQGFASQAYDQAQPEPSPQQAWQPPYPAVSPFSPPTPRGVAPEETTTLVFKDGRPAEQIRNYALSRTSIYITGAHIRQIPLAELDLPATVRVNQGSSTPFQLP